MIITDLKYAEYSLPFKSPFVTSKINLSNRRGIILKLIDDKDNYAYGEASPLAGFSPEGYADVIDKIDLLKKKIKEIRFDKNFKSVADFFPKTAKTPSLIFGFEHAVNSLLIISGEVQAGLRKTISINAVTSFSDEQTIIEQITSRVNSGYKTIKLKAGNISIDLLCRTLEALQKKFGDTLTLRVDVNRQWDFEEALQNIEQLAGYGIEYIEQPVISASDMLRLADKCSVPVAPDESITNYETAEQFLNHPNIKHIVLKPSIIGFNESMKIIRLANSKRKSVVVSSLFESGVGISGLLFLASHVEHETAHGLNTISFFERNFFDDNFQFVKPMIEFNPLNYPPNFNLSELKFQ